MRKRSGTEVFRITGTAAGLTDDVRGRQRRYIISMSVRTLSFILAVVLWHVSTPLAWIALVLGLVMPYIAVVIANAGRENAPDCRRPGSRRPCGRRSAPANRCCRRSGPRKRTDAPPPVRSEPFHRSGAAQGPPEAQENLRSIMGIHSTAGLSA